MEQAAFLRLKTLIEVFIKQGKDLSGSYAPSDEQSSIIQDFFDGVNGGMEHFHDQLAKAIIACAPHHVSSTLAALKDFPPEELVDHLLFPLAGSQSTAQNWPLYAAVLMYCDETLSEAEAVKKARTTAPHHRANPHNLLADLLEPKTPNAAPVARRTPEVN